VAYGIYNIGKVPNEQVAEVKKLVLGLMSEVASGAEHEGIGYLLKKLNKVKGDLHDELLVVILRRVVTGRCRYCPL
jgi:hypothetical protein